MLIVMPTALDATSSSTRRRNPPSARFGGLAEVVEELDRELAWQGMALTHRLHGSRDFTLRPLRRRVAAMRVEAADSAAAGRSSRWPRAVALPANHWGH